MEEDVAPRRGRRRERHREEGAQHPQGGHPEDTGHFRVARGPRPYPAEHIITICSAGGTLVRLEAEVGLRPRSYMDLLLHGAYGGFGILYYWERPLRGE
uniref:Uncharacterized protein n=1 Tax=Nonomuraea gerenzanensis TaxID=93944 RepID=A0A1M4E2A5_9ACTN|nr:hypothetical protein BN4615_P2474 [Nonomuraea gerenzanensis]